MTALPIPTKTAKRPFKSKQQVEHHRAPPKDNRYDTKKRMDDSSTPVATTSTRVCLKNIPGSFTSLQLRDFLKREYGARQSSSNEQLVITDCHVLMHPKKKSSRRIAFCGFQSTQMALTVVKLFDQTFCLTSKLSVQAAYAAAPKHVATTTTTKDDKKKGETEREKANKKGEKKKDDTTTKALLEMRSSKNKFWSNDFDISTAEPAQPETKQQDDEKDDDTSSDESVKGDTKDDDNVSTSGSDSSDDDADPLANKTIDQKHGGVMSDLDFLKSKQKMVDDLDDNDNDEDEDELAEDELAAAKEQKRTSGDDPEDGSKTKNNQEESSDDDSDSDDSSDDSSKEGTPSALPSNKKASAGTQKEASSKDQEMEEDNNIDDEGDDKTSLASDRLFVRNLPFTTTEEALEEHFAAFGTVMECHIPVDDRKMSKGFAFVTFDNKQDATHALEELDGGDFQGRFLHIMASRHKPQAQTDEHDTANNANGRPLSYKERQEQARKQEATKSSTGWSASFVRGDAVVDSLADRLGLKKGDILNVKDGLSSGDAAVRLALGETQVIEENRSYFKKHGIDMEALVSASPAGKEGSGVGSVKRSTTSILVKNLPYETLVEELAKVFHGVGDAPKRILLPPSRTIALIEYGHSSDAKRAFRKLAYRRFKSVPLYLEWAPLEAIDSETPVAEEGTMERPSSSKQVLSEDAEEEPALEGPTASIYIKNLNFSTTEEKLRQVFEKQVGDVRAVNIPKKLAPLKKPRAGDASSNQKEEMQSLSMGFGFVEFSSQESVRKALAKLQGTFLDGHALELKPSAKSLTQQSTIKASKSKNPTKVIVRNVPFQAARTELLKLFGSFGQLKRVRLPKKFDGGHRGFAFVDFVTHKEALAAMKSLSRTHLYGRHLVLEWAEDETEDPDSKGLDTLREKAQRDVSGADRSKNKRQRFS